MIAYRRRPSPLHAARAAVGLVYCTALAVAAMLVDHPLVLAAVTLAAILAGVLAGVGREIARAAWFAIPFALVVALINPLVSREGLTVIARLGELPVLGRLDITLEALAYGGVLGLRFAAVIPAAALYTAAVDPDDVLRLVRRVSFRSALTATLATRLVPVLARDGRRLADAQRCRPGAPPSRAALLRAVAGGALDRAVDVAAALELRGYGAARRPPRALRRPWSRHDAGFLAAGLAVVALALAGRWAGWAAFRPYPEIHAAGLPAAGLAAALLALALLPFADRRGIS
jgi:energy-coupling factor transport system permease protein